LLRRDPLLTHLVQYEGAALMTEPTADLREQVRARYAAAAIAVTGRSCNAGTSPGVDCCGPSAESDRAALDDSAIGASRYGPDERDQLPADAVTASLGCGNPVAVADLHEGETVLDLGSGGGIDVLLSARRVGPTGKAHGLDMTDEMLHLARANAGEAGATNVEFHKGHLEAIPLPDAAVDVVISNCVINLSVDKPAVFAETHRVLKSGGRIGISDIVAEDHLTPADRSERGNHVGCIAGALSISEYRDGLTAAGFTDIEITPTRQVADSMHSAIIRARKPHPTITP
jgi:SAM-dependent methyltransferase